MALYHEKLICKALMYGTFNKRPHRFTCHPHVYQQVDRGIEQACTRCHFAFALCCHSNATRAPIANPPNSAQLGGIPYHCPKLHAGPCNSVSMRPRTDRQTDRQTRITTIHFASPTTHAKCKNNPKQTLFQQSFPDIIM